MVKGRKPMLLTWHFICQTFGFLSPLTPHNTLLWVTSSQPPVKSRPPSASDHPDFLQTRGCASTHQHSASKASVEIS